MGKHAVLGAGNLGLDLVEAMHARGEDVFSQLFTKSRGFKYPCSLHSLVDFVPDHIWCCIGAGSVDQALNNYIPFLDLHLRLIVDLVQSVNQRVNLHFFSTDYAASGQCQSLYALSKVHMEETLNMLNRPNTYVYRVGSLYGEWKPCFPSKIKKVLAAKDSITLPANLVTPTPTKWLAEVLLDNCKTESSSTQFYNIAPRGNVSVCQWGEMIKEDSKASCQIQEGPVDPNRPAVSDIGCSFDLNDDWADLWSKYKV